MVFSPHQDDETLGCGGTIAIKRGYNVPVSVVFLTDGRFGVGDPGLSLNERIQLRKQEAITALEILGVEKIDIHFLDQLDGMLGQLDDRPRQQIIEQVAQLMQTYQPEEVYVPHRRDRHPDHEATYVLIQAAIEQANISATVRQYPIWILWKALWPIDLQIEEIAGAVQVEIATVQAQKQAAIAVYQSQHKMLPRAFLNQFLLPYELFW
jgi:N-acetylglucosamine malate deacetylase 1